MTPEVAILVIAFFTVSYRQPTHTVIIVSGHRNVVIHYLHSGKVIFAILRCIADYLALLLTVQGIEPNPGPFSNGQDENKHVFTKRQSGADPGYQGENAVSEDDPTQTEDSLSTQIATGKITQAATGEITQAATGEITQVATGEITQAATGGVPQAAIGEVTHVATGEITQAATGEIALTSANTSDDTRSRVFVFGADHQSSKKKKTVRFATEDLLRYFDNSNDCIQYITVCRDSDAESTDSLSSEDEDSSSDSDHSYSLPRETCEPELGKDDLEGNIDCNEDETTNRPDILPTVHIDQADIDILFRRGSSYSMQPTTGPSMDDDFCMYSESDTDESDNDRDDTNMTSLLENDDNTSRDQIRQDQSYKMQPSSGPSMEDDFCISYSSDSRSENDTDQLEEAITNVTSTNDANDDPYNHSDEITDVYAAADIEECIRHDDTVIHTEEEFDASDNEDDTKADTLSYDEDYTKADILCNVEDGTKGETLRNVEDGTKGETLCNVEDGTKGETLRNVEDGTKGESLCNVEDYTIAESLSNDEEVDGSDFMHDVDVDSLPCDDNGIYSPSVEAADDGNEDVMTRDDNVEKVSLDNVDTDANKGLYKRNADETETKNQQNLTQPLDVSDIVISFSDDSMNDTSNVNTRQLYNTPDINLETEYEETIVEHTSHGEARTNLKRTDKNHKWQDLEHQDGSQSADGPNSIAMFLSPPSHNEDSQISKTNGLVSEKSNEYRFSKQYNMNELYDASKYYGDIIPDYLTWLVPKDKSVKADKNDVIANQRENRTKKKFKITGILRMCF